MTDDASEMKVFQIGESDSHAVPSPVCQEDAGFNPNGYVGPFVLSSSNGSSEITSRILLNTASAYGRYKNEEAVQEIIQELPQVAWTCSS